MNNRLFELNGDWYIAKDESNTGVAEKWEKQIHRLAVKAYVPSIIQQFFPEYHGLAYYWCKFTPEILKNNSDRVLLRFGGVDYKADVWLNGSYLGSEESPETPFCFDVTDILNPHEENLLAVRVLNPCDKTIDGINLLNVPHRNKTIKKQAGSNLNHGGIWFGVSLETLPAAYIKDVFFIPDIKNGEVRVQTELALIGECEKAILSLKIRDNAYDSGEVASTISECDLSHGVTELDISAVVPNFKLWDIDSPNLYIAELTLKTQYGEHKITKKIGFREFYVEDGFFYLNGRKIFLKSSHTGNAFPIGQMLPVRPDHLRKDMIYAKSCGFNMIRSIAGLLRPEQLDIADEIGLMIYEECLASWCVGNSQINEWNDETSYAEVCAKYPEMPFGDEKLMLKRWRDNTDKMILRDRNHPSVVVWGLLNETKDNGVFREAVKYLPRARELDPTRFVILNSGRFDYDMSIGSASNPYSNEWEHTWGNDGKTEIIARAGEKKENLNIHTGDNHHYIPVPIDVTNMDVYRNYGKDTKAVLQSELGVGPMFNVIDEYRHFKQYGERLDLEDASWLEYQSNAIDRDFKRLGLDKIYPFTELMLRESQRNSALDRRMVFDIIRSNPRISDYSLTGLLDHGMCGEGLWTYWRHWKPEVFDAVSDGWEPLRFCLFPPHNIYSGEPVEIEAVLANDGVLKSGVYTANFALIGEQGTVYSCTKKFALDEKELAVPVIKESIDIDLPKGRYRLVAELEEAAARGSEIDFVIKDKKDNYIGKAEVSAIDLDEKAVKYLSENGVKVTEWLGEECKILLVGTVEADAVNMAIDAAEKGSSVFFLAKESFFNSVTGAVDAAKRVIGDIKRVYYYDWLYHKECVLADRTIFDGVGNGLAVLRDFVGVFPRHVFETDVTPDYPICPVFNTGYHAAKMAYLSAYAALGQNFGKGKVFFSSFDILNNIGTPTADRILSNIVKYLN